jgi:predicted  nucleic acid-binding Zn-ribbon protein
MVRGDLSAEIDNHKALAAGHAERADAHGTRARELELEMARLAGERDRARTALAQKQTDESDVLLRLGELDGLVGRIVETIEAEEARLVELEKAIASVEIPQPAPSPTEAAWGVAQQRIRKLSSELGDRDAELLLLHATVATAKKKMSELVELIQKARAGHSGEVAALLDRLAADASALAAG